MENKICTSLEQSKKLIELGIDRKSSDMYYWCGEDLRIGGHKAQDDEYDISAWSLTALLGLMPFQIIENNRYGFYQVKGFNKQGETYLFGYKTTNDFFLFVTSWHNDVVDAAFEMVCWLLENKKT